jgi:hypothetical protein
LGCGGRVPPLLASQRLVTARPMALFPRRPGLTHAPAFPQLATCAMHACVPSRSQPHSPKHPSPTPLLAAPRCRWPTQLRLRLPALLAPPRRPPARGPATSCRLVGGGARTSACVDGGRRTGPVHRGRSCRKVWCHQVKLSPRAATAPTRSSLLSKHARVAPPSLPRQDYYPYRTCKSECNPDICKRSEWRAAWPNARLAAAARRAHSLRPPTHTLLTACRHTHHTQQLSCSRPEMQSTADHSPPPAAHNHPTPPGPPPDYGVWQSREICCAPGVAFPEGCSARPAECWTVESFNLRTCIRDDRKCLQVQHWGGMVTNPLRRAYVGSRMPVQCATAATRSAATHSKNKPLYVSSPHAADPHCVIAWRMPAKEAPCPAAPRRPTALPASALPLPATRAMACSLLRRPVARPAPHLHRAATPT